MKKNIISILLVSTLLVGCGSTKPTAPCCNEETGVEKVMTKDPIMKLLVSGLIIYSINILFAR
jgi:hypothetical protein